MSPLLSVSYSFYQVSIAVVVITDFASPLPLLSLVVILRAFFANLLITSKNQMSSEQNCTSIPILCSLKSNLWISIIRSYSLFALGTRLCELLLNLSKLLALSTNGQSWLQWCQICIGQSLIYINIKFWYIPTCPSLKILTIFIHCQKCIEVSFNVIFNNKMNVIC